MLHSDPVVLKQFFLNICRNQIQADISGVEQRSGSRLPGVECGASFSDMSAGEKNLFLFSGKFSSLSFSDMSKGNWFPFFSTGILFITCVILGLERLADFLEATQEL